MLQFVEAESFLVSHDILQKKLGSSKAVRICKKINAPLSEATIRSGPSAVLDIFDDQDKRIYIFLPRDPLIREGGNNHPLSSSLHWDLYRKENGGVSKIKTLPQRMLYLHFPDKASMLAGLIARLLGVFLLKVFRRSMFHPRVSNLFTSWPSYPDWGNAFGNHWKSNELYIKSFFND